MAILISAKSIAKSTKCQPGSRSSCHSSLGRSTPLPTRPLPLHLPHTRSLSIYGLHMLPQQDLKLDMEQYFLYMVIRFPPLPLSPVNCSSLEVMYAAFQARPYMC